jgi:hypothetical protein
MKGWLGWSIGTLVVALCLLGAGCGRGGEGDDGVVSLRPGESLQDAIDRADPGAVIQLVAGAWDGNVVVSKSLTLRGDGKEKTVLRGVRPGYPVIRILNGDSTEPVEVLIESLQVSDAQGTTCAEFEQFNNRLRGYRQSLNEICPYGILVEGSVTVRISECLVTDNRTGIAGIGSASIDIRNSEIRGNDWEGIYVAGTAVVTVQGSLIVRNGAAGVGVANEGTASITECTVESNVGDGVGVADLARVDVSRSTIAGNGWSGLKLVSGAIATVDSSRIIGNAGYGIAPLSGDCYPDEPSYAGVVFGKDNWIPGPEAIDGNKGGAICPEYPGNPWPEGFLSTEPPNTDH